jgi:hypothetical protein
LKVGCSEEEGSLNHPEKIVEAGVQDDMTFAQMNDGGRIICREILRKKKMVG